MPWGGHPEGDIEKAHFVQDGADRGELDGRVRGAMAGIDQVLQVIFDVFPIELMRRAPEPAQQRDQGAEVGGSGFLSVTPDLEFASDDS